MMYDDLINTSIEHTSKYCESLHLSGVVPEYEDILSSRYSEQVFCGDVVVDVGLNHGLHSKNLLSLVGDSGLVVAFEPVPDFVELVKREVGSDIRIIQKALSDKSGVGKFLHMTKAIGESGFLERVNVLDRGAVEILVEISTLDAELKNIDRLKFIKIDVEGHEISVLKGGADTIKKFRPLISIEYGKPTYSLYGLSSDSLYVWAMENNYTISDLWYNPVRSLDEWVRVCDKSYWDYLLIPSESSILC